MKAFLFGENLLRARLIEEIAAKNSGTATWVSFELKIVTQTKGQSTIINVFIYFLARTYGLNRNSI